MAIQQDTDPWEIALNKEVEYTVYLEIPVNSETLVITVGYLITAMQAQQPIVRSGDTIFNIRMIATKLWGVPGGSCMLVPYEIDNSTTTAEVRTNKYDVGDGVTRPTCDYSWPNADMTKLINGTASSTVGLMIAQCGTGTTVTSRGGLLYMKFAVHSNLAVTLPIPSQMAYGVEDMYNKCKRKHDEECKIIAVKRVKDMTLPIISE